MSIKTVSFLIVFYFKDTINEAGETVFFFKRNLSNDPVNKAFSFPDARFLRGDASLLSQRPLGTLLWLKFFQSATRKLDRCSFSSKNIGFC